MSFRSNNYSGYGATDSRIGGQSQVGRQAKPNFDLALYHQLCDDTSCKIFDINNNVTALEKALKEIGSKSDSHQLRNKIHATRQSTKDLVRDTTQHLRQLTSTVTVNGTREHKLQSERLRNEFAITLQRYDTLQKQLDPKLKKTILQTQPTSKNIWGTDEDDEEEKQSLIATHMQQQMLQEDLEFEQGLLREREDAILKIETDILDVNKVFRDLAVMVHEQGETIGTIEENITSVAYNVEEANEQLLKARNYEKASRKKLCFLIFILIVIAVIVAIIVSVSLP